MGRGLRRGRRRAALLSVPFLCKKITGKPRAKNDRSENSANLLKICQRGTNGDGLGNGLAALWTELIDPQFNLKEVEKCAESMGTCGESR